MESMFRPFFSISGQLDRLGNVGRVLGEIGSNLISGNLLTGVKGNTGVPVVDKILNAATSPLGIASTALVGAGIATGIKAAVGAGASGAATQGTNSILKTEPAGPTVPQTKNIGSNFPGAFDKNSLINGTTDLVKKAGTGPSESTSNQTLRPTISDQPPPNTPPANTDPMASLPDFTDVIAGKTDPASAAAAIIKDNLVTSIPSSIKKSPSSSKRKAKKKTSVARTRSSSRSSKKKSSKKKRGFGTEAEYNRPGGKKVFYTKTGQPFIKLKSGKARFIRRSKK